MFLVSVTEFSPNNIEATAKATAAVHPFPTLHLDNDGNVALGTNAKTCIETRKKKAFQSKS